MAINKLLLTEFNEEMKKTRTALERVPVDKKDFAPHPKSMPLGKLAPHIAQLAGFGVAVLTTPELDFSKSSYKPLQFESSAQLLSAFDEGADKVRTALQNTSDEAWEQNWTLSSRGQAHFQRNTFPGLPANVPESPGASPRPARGVPAFEREGCSGAPTGHRRTTGWDSD